MEVPVCRADEQGSQRCCLSSGSAIEVGGWVLAATAGSVYSGPGPGPAISPWPLLSSPSSPRAWPRLTARHALAQTHLPMGVPPSKADLIPRGGPEPAVRAPLQCGGVCGKFSFSRRATSWLPFLAETRFAASL